MVERPFFFLSSFFPVRPPDVVYYAARSKIIFPLSFNYKNIKKLKRKIQADYITHTQTLHLSLFLRVEEENASAYLWII